MKVLKMIDHKNKFIFIHIPKCAGNSIKPCLGIPKFPGDHSKIKDAKYVDSIEGDFARELKYFKFTFVRNPWDRFLSAYFYLKNGGMHNKPDLYTKKQIDQYDSFKKFILEAPFFEYVHFQPMFDRIEIDGKDQMDFVGKTENLQEDFHTVCGKIGVACQRLSRENSSNHEHYTECYDDETRNFIAHKYAKDVEYFGYKFGE